MSIVYLNNSNFKSAIASSSPGTYFLIEEDIAFSDASVSLPGGCVLDFRGGSLAFQGSQSTAKLNLNNSDIIAGGYCIFSKSIDVSGLSNSLVRAEWFHDKQLEEHVCIHRALTAANGAPVTLENRLYELYGPITFPQLDNGISQTLISPGILKLKSEIAAINLDVSYVQLKINRIDGVYQNSNSRIGTGILMSGNCFHVDIDVFHMTSLHKGISICPDSRNTDTGRGIQYCKVVFQAISADYCIYIDIYSNSKTDRLTNWFTETLFIGGKLSGIRGIYFADPILPNSYGPDCIQFFNIGLERLTGIPVRLVNATALKLEALRMAEDLPGLVNETNPIWDSDATWVYLNGVSNSQISVKGTLAANRFNAEGTVRNVTVKAFFIDNYGYETVHFDTLVFNMLPNVNGQNVATKVVTSSIQPYNLCKTITAIGPETGGIVQDTTYMLRDLLPYHEDSITSGELTKTCTFNILPRTLNAIVSDDNNLILNLNGLEWFAPCFFDVYADISPAGMITFVTETSNGIFTETIDKTDKLNEEDEDKDENKKTVSMSFNERGLYRLTWDEKWRLIISKITE